ncbi:hypothetical protein IEO21_10195 [Rhodonia placenta]|uniref:Uncharacterized protein n=1 Tax=Rhodonia placenta TaxID=104341 RepID=A0A8H7TX66_9APHY|nr:hypothetical protein IEO21_10195 [Postia placenta]
MYVPHAFVPYGHRYARGQTRPVAVRTVVPTDVTSSGLRNFMWILLLCTACGPLDSRVSGLPCTRNR